MARKVKAQPRITLRKHLDIVSELRRKQTLADATFCAGEHLIKARDAEIARLDTLTKGQQEVIVNLRSERDNLMEQHTSLSETILNIKRERDGLRHEVAGYRTQMAALNGQLGQVSHVAMRRREAIAALCRELLDEAGHNERHGVFEPRDG